MVASIALAYAWVVLSKAAGFQPSADSHYHFTVAHSMLKHGLWPSPAQGLPWTLFAQLPVDHYWAFHVLLLPFAATSNYALGLKLATCCGFALVLTAVTVFLARRQVNQPAVWALLCAIFSNQDWRYLQLRGAQLMLPLLLIHVELLAFTKVSRRRSLLLVLTAWFAMLSYHGALLLFPVAGCVALTSLCYAAPSRPLATRLLVGVHDLGVTAVGLAMGLVLNPYADWHGTTFRFCFYHVWHMGRDTHNLYADQAAAEFHGMSPAILAAYPEWGLLLLVTLACCAWLLVCHARAACRIMERKSVAALAASAARAGEAQRS